MRYIRFYYHYARALVRWHLRLTRSRPGHWWMGRVLWTSTTTYHPKRRIWGAESRRPKEAYIRRIHGPMEITTEYIHPSEGSAGKGDYLFEIPKGCEISGAIPIRGWKP